MTVRLEADAVFTVDPADTVLAPGAVEIDEGVISWVGDPWQVPPATGTEVHRLGGLLMPGLVNCHGHSPMALLRSAGDGLPLDRWLHEAVWPREARLEDEDVYWGMLLGAVRAPGQRRHHDLRAVPASRAGRGRSARRRHPGHVHAGDLRRARRRAGEQLGGVAGRLLRDRRRHGGEGRAAPDGLRAARGLHGAARGPAHHCGGGARSAARCCRSISPRRRPSAPWCRSATG